MIRAVLATWNISECVSAKWDVGKGIVSNPSLKEILKNCNEIVEMINKYDIDVICLQEIPIIINNDDIIVQIVTKNTKLKHYYGVDTYPTFLVNNGYAGVAVFSKYKMVSTEFSYMKNPEISKISKTGKVYYSFDKGVITAELLFEKEKLTIVTGHGFSFSPFDAIAEDYPDSFSEISRCALKALENANNVVVLGDFNTESLFKILPELSGLFKENISGPTTVSGVMEGADFKKGRKLDYILTSSNILSQKTITVKNFSDHYLCICECFF